MQYRITSGRFAGGKVGDVVSSDRLVGVDVEALVAGGHLAPAAAANTRKPEPTTKEQD